MTATALALLLYIEAAGEPVDGIHAVASVVHNRAVESGRDYKAVINAPKQFSGWRKGIRRRAYNEAMTTHQGFAKWEECMRIAQSMVAGEFRPSVTANHYYNPRLCTPPWGHLLADVKMIGRHKFGRL